MAKAAAKSNYHMHTTFCDGKNPPEDYVLQALEKGMESIGFSAHMPLHIPNDWSMKENNIDEYFKEISHLKQKYLADLEIYAGFEMDYLATANKNIVNQYINMADFTIGSVHYLYDKKADEYYSTEDSFEAVKKGFEMIGGGDNQKFVKAYYQELVKVVQEYKPDIIGHLDVIRKQNLNNIYFDEKEEWYVKLIDEVLDNLTLTGSILEVNNGAILYNSLDDTYPSTWILEKVYEKKIPIVVSSDAHKAEDIDGLFAETIAKLKKIGFTKQKMLKAGKWIDVEL